MKRWNLFMMLVAWVAMSFISCSTDSIEPTDLTPQGVTRTLILSSEKPLIEDEVRTQHNGTTIVWSSDDLIRSTYCHSATGWSEDLVASTKTALTNENSTAAFTVPYEFPAEASAGTYQFYACHPSTQWNGGNKAYSGEGDVSLSLPTEQAMPRAATYDEKGDLLIGASVETPTEAPAEGAVLHFNYKRLVSHACVTLKSLKGATADEIVSSVTFTAPVALAGTATANFESQSLTTEFDAKSVTVYLPANTKANAEVAVWFCSAPATIAEGETLQVVVETNRATYTRTITARTEGIHFVQNKRSLLSISLGTEDTQKEEKEITYVWKLVTSASDITEGEYILASKFTDGTYSYLPNSQVTSDKAMTTKNESLSADELADSKVTDDMKWNFVASGSAFRIQSQANSKWYLYTTGSTGANVRVSTYNSSYFYNWTFAVSATKGWEIKNNKPHYLAVYATDHWRNYGNNSTNQNGSFRIFKRVVADSGNTGGSGSGEGGGDSGDSGDDDQGGTTTGVAVTLDFASLSAVQGTVDGVTFESIKNSGNAPAYNANNKELRIYRYNGLNISAEKNIAKIEITFSSASNMGYEFNTTNGGTYTADSATSKGTWTGSQTAVNFLNNGDAANNVQARIKSIVVTFAE